MDQGLFVKHIQSLLSRSTAKKEIIAFLLEKTGVQVEEEEITLSKKNILLSMSSVKKTSLIQKGSKDILQGIGYTLSI